METNKLLKGIIDIQTNLNIFAKKGARNTMGKGYQYFTETDLYNALKPEMEKAGIGYTIGALDEPKFQQVGNMWMYSSKGKLTLFHSEGNIMEIEITLSAINTDPAKAIGSALTYGTRYWLCKTFGIATEELDPDTTELTEKLKQEKVIEKPKIILEQPKKELNNLSLLEQVQQLAKTSIDIRETAKNTIKNYNVNKLSELPDQALQEILNW